MDIRNTIVMVLAVLLDLELITKDRAAEVLETMDRKMAGRELPDNLEGALWILTR